MARQSVRGNSPQSCCPSRSMEAVRLDQAHAPFTSSRMRLDWWYGQRLIAEQAPWNWRVMMPARRARAVTCHSGAARWRGEWGKAARRPGDPNQSLAMLALGPGAVATSTITKRRWWQGGNYVTT